MISCMIGSGGPRTLRANLFQDPKEQHRSKTCKEAVARFLRETVSDHIGDGMRSRGVGEEEAEVDTVYNGSLLYLGLGWDCCFLVGCITA